MFRSFMRMAVFLSLLSSCGSVDYENAPVGKFKGSLFVMWVGEGGPLGDGAFVFVPNPRNRLTFNRDPDAGNYNRIQPEMMYTDGGSIPKIGQVFNGFSPWGYAPAYMIHDWLFIAHRCNEDGKARPEEKKFADMKFQESADIIAEAIKTLGESGKVKKNDIAGNTISSVVAGPFSRKLWNVKGACLTRRVSEDDRKAAEAAIPGSSRTAVFGAFRTLPDGSKIPLKPASFVAVVQF